MPNSFELNDEEKIIIYSLGALDRAPLRSKIKLHKLLFLFSNVFKDYRELLEFDPHLFGPYSETINYLIEDLEKLELIEIRGSQYILTDKGWEIYNKFRPKKELLSVLEDFKEFLNDLSDDEILAFIYVSYPNYIGESAKWDELKNKRVDLAISLLKKGKISYGKAVEISGVKSSRFEDIIRERRIKWKHDY